MRTIILRLFENDSLPMVANILIVILIILILDNVRLRYIRRIKDKIIDNQCKDINNAMNGRKDLVLKRMNQDVDKRALNCRVCKFHKKKKNPCKVCKDFSEFKYTLVKK